MDNTIIFDTSVTIDPDDFMTFWNESEYSEHGVAMPAESGFKSLEIAMAIIGAAAMISNTLVKEAVVTYLKRLNPTKTVTVTTETDEKGHIIKVTTVETTTSLK